MQRKSAPARICVRGAQSRQILVNAELLLSASANSLAPSSPILFPCNPAKIKSPDVNHNVQTKSALTTHVHVDNCGVFREQFGPRFGSAVAVFVPCKQTKNMIARTERETPCSHMTSRCSSPTCCRRAPRPTFWRCRREYC